MQATPEHCAPRPRIALLALILLAFWSITAASHDLWGPDETRYTQVSRELLGRGNWLLLTLHGKPYDEKPPLPFWILAGMLKLRGGEVSELLLRLPAILMGIFTLLLVYDIGRRRFGEKAGWLAALTLATMPVFIDNAALVRLDMPLAAWTTLSLWAWLTRGPDERLGATRIAIFWLGIIGGFFTKGPIILLFVAPVMAWECLAARSWRPLRAIGILWGLGLLLLTAGVWFVGQARSAGSKFVFAQIHDQTVQRFSEGAHAGPFYYYLVHCYIFAPWVFVLIPLGRDLWRARKSMPREVIPLLGWTLVPLIIFSIAHGKRQVYLLPLAPGLALLVAWYLAPHYQRLRHWIHGAALLIALPMLVKGVWLDTKHNAAQSPRPFAQKLDEILTARHLSELGGVKDGGIAEYHVYGHYGVTELTHDQVSDPLPANLPAVIVLREDEKEIQKYESTLVAAGYARVHREKVDGDVLVVYARPAAPKTSS